MAERLIVVIACGWLRKPRDEHDVDALCCELHDRIALARDLLTNDDLLAVTGCVPYDADGVQLAEVINAALDHGAEAEIPGFGAMSEAGNVMNYARRIGVQEIAIITSAFYLKGYALMWRDKAKHYGIKVRFHPTTGHASPKVVRFYTLVGVAYRIARSVRLAWLLESGVTLVQKRRRRGFSKSGCFAI